MTIVDKTDTLVVVALIGRLDSQTVPALETAFDQFAQSGHKYVVLDFAAVTLLASSGLRLLLRLENLCAQQQGALAFAAVPEPVSLVLELAGFAPHFSRFSDVAAARAALNA